MIEEDPDNESFFRKRINADSNADNNVPVSIYHLVPIASYNCMHSTMSCVQVKFHVVFFDTPVSRGWIHSHSIVPYTDDEENPNEKFNVNFDLLTHNYTCYIY